MTSYYVTRLWWVQRNIKPLVYLILSYIILSYIILSYLILSFRFLAESYSMSHTKMANPDTEPCEKGEKSFANQGGITNGAQWYSVAGGEWNNLKERVEQPQGEDPKFKFKFKMRPALDQDCCLLTHCPQVVQWCVSDLVNIGSGNGLLLDGTKPLSESLSSH